MDQRVQLIQNILQKNISDFSQGLTNPNNLINSQTNENFLEYLLEIFRERAMGEQENINSKLPNNYLFRKIATLSYQQNPITCTFILDNLISMTG